MHLALRNRLFDNTKFINQHPTHIKQLLNEEKYSAYLLEVNKVNNTKYIQ